jgi:hypothetical protein
MPRTHEVSTVAYIQALRERTRAVPAIASRVPAQQVLSPSMSRTQAVPLLWADAVRDPRAGKPRAVQHTFLDRFSGLLGRSARQHA